MDIAPLIRFLNDSVRSFEIGHGEKLKIFPQFIEFLLDRRR
jgi:hypothetical protein